LNQSDINNNQGDISVQPSANGGVDFNDMLNRVLSDPDALNNVMRLAKNIMDDRGTPSQSEKDGPSAENNRPSPMPETGIPQITSMKLPKMLSYDPNRVRLLEALKPYLGDGRRDKISYLLNIMQILRLLEKGGDL